VEYVAGDQRARVMGLNGEAKNQKQRLDAS